MSHPDLDRLTSWVHGLLEPGESETTRSHVADCPDCAEDAEVLREEARLLSREILPPERIAALKEAILESAEARRPSRWRGLLRQIPAAAIVLIGLVATLLPGGARHRLLDGRVTLQDGRVVDGPLDLDGSRSWRMQAVEKAQVRLSDRSTVDLGPGARLALAPGGTRGVRADVTSGEVLFTVSPEPKPLTIESPAGYVDAAGGKFSMRIVFNEQGEQAMNKALAGALVTVVAGTISLTTPQGTAEARTGQSAVLAPAQTPLFLNAPQDKQEELLRRLEQLAARVAKLEDEVSQLEAKNKQLKAQVQSNAPGAPGGAVWSVNGAQGVKVIQAGGGSATGASVIIELKEGAEEKPERKSTPEKK